MELRMIRRALARLPLQVSERRILDSIRRYCEPYKDYLLPDADALPRDYDEVWAGTDAAPVVIRLLAIIWMDTYLDGHHEAPVITVTSQVLDDIRQITVTVGTYPREKEHDVGYSHKLTVGKAAELAGPLRDAIQNLTP